LTTDPGEQEGLDTPPGDRTWSTMEQEGAGDPAPVRPAVILVTLDGVRWQEVFGGTDVEQAKRAKMPEQEILTARQMMPNFYAHFVDGGAVLGAPEQGPAPQTSEAALSLPGVHGAALRSPRGALRLQPLSRDEDADAARSGAPLRGRQVPRRGGDLLVGADRAGRHQRPDGLPDVLRAGLRHHPGQARRRRGEQGAAPQEQAPEPVPRLRGLPPRLDHRGPRPALPPGQAPPVLLRGPWATPTSTGTGATTRRTRAPSGRRMCSWGSSSPCCSSGAPRAPRRR
jgi:hypothetical protein